MKIPKKIRIGRKKFRVEQVEKIEIKRHRPAAGMVVYLDGLITLATHSAYTKKPHPPEYISESFWHEVTHAILHDMGHSLETSEKFVTAFSQRLNKVVLGAEL